MTFVKCGESLCDDQTTCHDCGRCGPHCLCRPTVKSHHIECHLGKPTLCRCQLLEERDRYYFALQRIVIEGALKTVDDARIMAAAALRDSSDSSKGAK